MIRERASILHYTYVACFVNFEVLLEGKFYIFKIVYVKLIDRNYLCI
jgi:hypothetical protein